MNPLILRVSALTFLTCLPLAAAPLRKPLFEPPFPDSGPVAANLLLKCKATASGHWSDRKPELAVDGDLSDQNHWACEGLPAWWAGELPAPKTVGSIRIKPYRSDGRFYQFLIEGSLDGLEWFTLADHRANSITAPEEGNWFEFPPREVRRIRVTFTHNSAGAKSGAHIVEIEAYPPGAGAEPRLEAGSVDVRYAPAGGTPANAPAAKARAWRGERANLQLLATAGRALPQCGHLCAGLRGPGGKTLPVTLSWVRHTLADGKPVADILDPIETLDIAAGARRPLWVSVDVPRDAEPGNYAGDVVIRSTKGTAKLPVSLEVLPATLPAPKDWKIHVDLWQHPDAVARYHDVPLWSPEHFALMKPLMKRLADAGQKTITCTLIDEAWGGQTYDRFTGMIGWYRKADGSWRYDYTVFDRWVAFMIDEVGLDGRIHCYTMIPWSLKFSYIDEATGLPGELSLKPGSPEYESHWAGFLKDFTRHLREKGWQERTRIGIDERPDALLRPVLALLAKHAPELKVASAINHRSDLNNGIDDVSPAIGTSGEFDLKLLDARRAGGKRTTYYVCCGPMVPNTFTFSPPAESEWLGIFAAAQHFDGFLRWAYNSWVENPFVSTDYVTWPSGDCFLVYPGNRSSIRFERLRDGFEDFEKIRLLRETAAKSGKTDALTELERVLSGFTRERSGKPGVHADDVRAANDAIDRAVGLLKP
ncbi:MAG: DUF4091 domain-containing protein [Verrucomicrobia bacterium]|nr:DUF4091 domain-containing protein [Verrucomicrobiota bacterium]